MKEKPKIFAKSKINGKQNIAKITLISKVKQKNKKKPSIVNIRGNNNKKTKLVEKSFDKQTQIVLNFLAKKSKLNKKLPTKIK